LAVSRQAIGGHSCQIFNEYKTTPINKHCVCSNLDANATSALSDTAVVQTVTIYDPGKAAQILSILMAFVDAAGLADLLSR